MAPVASVAKAALATACAALAIGAAAYWLQRVRKSGVEELLPRIDVAAYNSL